MNVTKRLKRKSWVRYAMGRGDLVDGDHKRYTKGIAADERACKRREATIKAAKTRRDKAAARIAAQAADAREADPAPGGYTRDYDR